jgi:hypothetical protein
LIVSGVASAMKRGVGRGPPMRYMDNHLQFPHRSLRFGSQSRT